MEDLATAMCKHEVEADVVAIALPSTGLYTHPAVQAVNEFACCPTRSLCHSYSESVYMKT